METLATGMQNLRLSQFFSKHRRPRGEDIERIEDGLNFIRRSLAAVSYLQEGATEGLEPIALTEARYTSKTVEYLRLATDYPSFRSFLERLANLLAHILEKRDSLSETDYHQLEIFFGMIGQAMVSEVLDGSLVDEAEDQ
jgi:hypothetical protein